MRKVVTDLSPGRSYNIQIRSVSGDQVSEWSPNFTMGPYSKIDAPPALDPLDITVSTIGDKFFANWTYDAIQNDFSYYEYKWAYWNGSAYVDSTTVYSTLLGPGIFTSSNITLPLTSQTVSVTDASTLPTSGTVYIAGTAVAYTSKSGNVLVDCTASGTGTLTAPQAVVTTLSGNPSSGNAELDYATNLKLFTTAKPRITISVRAVDTSGLRGAWVMSSTDAINASPTAPTFGITKNISSITGTTTRTITLTEPHDFSVGDYITISNVTPSPLNETVKILAVPSPATITYSPTDKSSSYTSGGKISNGVTASTDTIKFRWTPSADDDIDYYELWKGSSSGFSTTTGKLIGSTKTTIFSYTSSEYVDQYFQVRSVDKFGQPSLFSNSVFCSPLAPQILNDLKTTISSYARASGSTVVTFTCANAHGLSVGNYVIISDTFNAEANTLNNVPVLVTGISGASGAETVFTCSPNAGTTALAKNGMGLAWGTGDIVQVRKNGIVIGNIVQGNLVGIYPTSFTMQSSITGSRIVISNTGIDGYISGNNKTVRIGNDGTFDLKSATTGNRLEISGTNGIRIMKSGTNYVAVQIDSEGVSGYDTSVIDFTGNPTYKTFDLKRDDGSLALASASIRTGQLRKLPVASRTLDDTNKQITFTTAKKHGISAGDYVRVSNLWDEQGAAKDITVASGAIYCNLESAPTLIYPQAAQVKIDSTNPQYAGTWGVYDHGHFKMQLNSYARLNQQTPPSSVTTTSFSQVYINTTGVNSVSDAPSNSIRTLTTSSAHSFKLGQAVRLSAVSAAPSASITSGTISSPGPYTLTANIPLTSFLDTNATNPTRQIIVNTVTSTLATTGGISRTAGSTVITFTTAAAHGLLTGSYVQIANTAGAAADTPSGTFVQITKTGENTFTCSPNSGTTALNTGGGYVYTNQKITYTGKTTVSPYRFTGCTGGTGTVLSLSVAKQVVDDDVLVKTVGPSASEITFVSPRGSGFYDSNYIASYTISNIANDVISSASHSLLDGNTFRLPSTTTAGVGIISSSSLISTASYASNLITYTTTAAHTFFTGQTISIAGAANTAYNLNNVVIVSATPGSTTFTVNSSAVGMWTAGGQPTASTFINNVDHEVLQYKNQYSFRYIRKDTGPITSTTGYVKANWWSADFGEAHPFDPSDSIAIYSDYVNQSTGATDYTHIYYDSSTETSALTSSAESVLTGTITGMFIPSAKASNQKGRYEYATRINNLSTLTTEQASRRVRYGGYVSPASGADYQKVMILSNTDSSAKYTMDSKVSATLYFSVSNGTFRVFSVTDDTITVEAPTLPSIPSPPPTATYTDAIIEKVSAGIVLEESNGNPYVAMPSGSTDKFESPGTLAGVKSSGRKKITISSVTRPSGSYTATFVTDNEHNFFTGDYVEITNCGGSTTSSGADTKAYTPVMVTKANDALISTASYNNSLITYTTTAPHQFSTGETIKIFGAANTEYNLNSVVIVSATPGNTTFTVNSSPVGTWTAGGTPTVSSLTFSCQPNLQQGTPAAVSINSTVEKVIPIESIYTDNYYLSNLGAKFYTLTSNSKTENGYNPLIQRVKCLMPHGLSNADSIKISNADAYFNFEYPKIKVVNPYEFNVIGDGPRRIFSNVFSVANNGSNYLRIILGSTAAGSGVYNVNLNSGTLFPNDTKSRLSVGDEVWLACTSSAWNDPAAKVKAVGNTGAGGSPANAGYIDLETTYANGTTYTAQTGAVTFVSLYRRDGIVGSGSANGQLYLLQNQRPQVYVSSPTTNYEKSSSSIALEPGTSKKYSSVTQTGATFNVGASNVGGDGSSSNISSISSSSSPSTSRIILNAGEVVFTANYSKAASVSWNTSNWEPRDNYGVYLTQEMDGWWCLNGMLWRKTRIGTNISNVFTICTIDSDFARPENNVLLPAIAGFTTAAGSGPQLISLEVKPDGRVVGWFPKILAETTTTNKLIGSYLWGETESTDWISLSGIRWKTVTKV